MSKTSLFLRSLCFGIVQVIFTPIWACICFLTIWLPFPLRYYIATRWNVATIWFAKIICGIDYQVIGKENLPNVPSIILSKHQSAWETIFLITVPPRPLSFVLKKELLYIPFFGWALALMRNIPIDRSQGVSAIRQLVRKGNQRLKDGQWVVIFPEGTRTTVGKKGKYLNGGSRLAIESGAPVVPIALNAGECWPRNSFIKKPGLITVSIGKPIDPKGRSADDLMSDVQNWIESEMLRISPDIYPSNEP